MPRNQRNKTAHLVSVAIGGISFKMVPNSIDKKLREPLHGEFKGEKVNSPAMLKLGTKPSDSVIVWPDENKPQAYAMSIAAAGVFSTKFLESEGKSLAAT
ncbi:MAG: hypothetical protein WC814_00855 [Candidatus Paceibacterota bacterium]